MYSAFNSAAHQLFRQRFATIFVRGNATAGTIVVVSASKRMGAFSGGVLGFALATMGAWSGYHYALYHQEMMTTQVHDLRTTIYHLDGRIREIEKKL